MHTQSVDIFCQTQVLIAYFHFCNDIPSTKFSLFLNNFHGFKERSVFDSCQTFTLDIIKIILWIRIRDNFRYYLNLRYCEKATRSVKFKFWNQCFSDLRSIRKNICNIRGLRLPIKWTHSKILVKYSVQNLSDETHTQIIK